MVPDHIERSIFNEQESHIGSESHSLTILSIIKSQIKSNHPTNPIFDAANAKKFGYAIEDGSLVHVTSASKSALTGKIIPVSVPESKVTPFRMVGRKSCSFERV